MNDNTTYDFVVIGAGIAGSTAFYHLSQVGSTLLIDEHAQNQAIDILKIYPAHNYAQLPEIPLDNKQIFPNDHNTSMYASQTQESIVDSHEFHKPFGKIMNQRFFTQWLQDEATKKGGKILWGQRAIDAQTTEKEILLQICSTDNEDSSKEGQIIHAQVLILATGSYGFDLQHKLGFSTPESFNVIYFSTHGDASVFPKVIPTDYQYRLHPQISTEGPFALMYAQDIFNVGYISKEAPEIMYTKFMRILQNYKPIQPAIQSLPIKIASLTEKDFIFAKCSKYSLKVKVKDRIAVIGEAAGILTPVYYEGILGAIASAKSLKDVLQELKSRQSQYTAMELEQYNRELNRRVKNYYAGADATELLFMKSGASQMTIWNSYLDCIQKEKKLREYIHYAYIHPDPATYPLDHDEFSGELIYKNLPLAQKVLLSPLFLRAKFS